jgi:hypothetical protein
LSLARLSWLAKLVEADKADCCASDHGLAVDITTDLVQLNIVPIYPNGTSQVAAGKPGCCNASGFAQKGRPEHDPFATE